MKIEEYLRERFDEVWRAIERLNKTLYGNGEEKGIKTKLSNVLAIKKHNRWLIGAFCVVLLAVIWTSGYWAFKVAVNQIVDERNTEIVEMINELDYKIAERNEISPELIKELTEKIIELNKIADEPIDIILDFYE